jgi:uncharacterized repeat protein (TIGR01451 family)
MFKRNKGLTIFNLLVILIVILMVHGTGVAQGPGPASQFTATPLMPESTFQISKAATTTAQSRTLSAGTVSSDKLVSVIVKLKGGSLAANRAVVSGRIDLKSNDSQAYLAQMAQQQSTFEAAALKAAPKAQVTHRFDVVLGGVSMIVPADKVSEIAKLPGVEAIYPDELLQLDTDNSPQFIGATTAWDESGGQENAGESVIVGVLDTGIWPEHPSFSDPDPSGKPYSPLASWHGTACQFGSAIPGDVPFTCNNKLVGAARFMATYSALQPVLPGEYLSARDDDGHGTHTSSTAAGNAGVAASIFGISRGTISGVAPRARVAMYKVCGAAGCYGSDSAAAVQQAILDGVNVINFSISGGTNPYADVVELAFLDAYNAGVFVAASAGNSGPTPETVAHRGPWVTTVAASTQNRAFENTATVTADGGASLTLHGASLTQGVGPAPVVVPTSNPFCIGAFPAGSVAGQIVVCQRGGGPGRAEKGYDVLQGGAVGMILYNNAANVTDLETDNHYLPAIHIQYADGQALLNFISTHTNIQATLTQGAKVAAQGDVMASFSSRGGPGQTLGISKPDVTAPGVQILAGHSPQHLLPPAGVALGPQGELFQAIAGTSMSSPHVAGAAALLKDLQPNWTPGKIKSALMTTARTSVVKEDGITQATPFDFGSGRIDLNSAVYTHLTFDETGANYVALQNQLWNANYPSLYVPVMPGAITVQRTVHNETNKKSIWKPYVVSPPDVTVVVPKQIVVPASGNATFSITVMAPTVPSGEVRHALIRFKMGSDEIDFPITIVRGQPVVTLSKTCDPASFPRGAQTACVITATNTSFDAANVTISDQLPKQLNLIAGSVTGATPSGNGLTFNGTLAGAQPPNVSIGPGSSPAGGYLPLSLFGIAPVSGVTDDSLTNFNVPAFRYGGQSYTRVGFASNGYAVVGGGTSADIAFIGQNLPDPARPNNTFAPYWTDLNPPAGGALRIATLTDGVNTWIVMDWAGVREFSLPRLNSFEIWIRIGTVEDISFAYGTIQGNGDGGLLTVGAENLFGNRGQNYYYNGTGTLPSNGTQLVVTTTPPQPGETHLITFMAGGTKKGTWQNCAQLTSDLFQGTNISCFSGEVTK